MGVTKGTLFSRTHPPNPIDCIRMKALIILPTLLLALSSWNLPKVNTAPEKVGKNIKAADITTADLHGDSILLTEVLFETKGTVKINTVVIDPGHGGHDPGCSGANSKEKHLALAIGKYLAEALRQNYPDLKVVMTRSTDVFVPLHERAAIATKAKADLFISIHCNFIPKASHVHGTETYVLGLHATDANLEVAKRENASILYEDNYQETYGYDPNSPEAHIVFSMFQNAFLEQSIRFAQKVQQHSAGAPARKDRGVKQAGFLVLRHATMPSVLVEAGYLSNRNEEDYLRSDKGQREMANALLEAFAEYKSEMEGSGQAAPLAKLDTKNAKNTPSADVATTATASLGSLPTETASVVAVPVKAEPSPNLVLKEKTAPVATESAAPAKTAPAKTNVPPAPSGKIIPTNPISDKGQTLDPPAAQSADIQYRVQLAASPKPLDISHGKWKNVDYLIEVVVEGNLYKYQVRNFATPGEAQVAKQKLRELGFNDAFVAAYQNGQRIN